MSVKCIEHASQLFIEKPICLIEFVVHTTQNLIYVHSMRYQIALNIDHARLQDT